MNEETIQGFADLFQGGKIAQSHKDGYFAPMEATDGTHFDASGTVYLRAVEAHLTEDNAGIGVYPLVALEDPTDGSHSRVVHWGCVDWDDGLAESFKHANNVYNLLKQLGVRSWVETSRSKGHHLWVFFEKPLPARKVREGLIGACNIVDAPIKEVNPKQIELTGKGFGNGLRLPYPHDHETGRQEMNNLEYSFSIVPAQVFVEEALPTRVTAEQWEQVHTLYKQAEPPPVRRESFSYTGRRLTGLAEAIRRNGPRRTADKPHGDRSSTLFGLACAMIRQGYTDGDIMTELTSADQDWGGKFALRHDGEQRLRRLIDSAHTDAWKDREKYNTKNKS